MPLTRTAAEQSTVRAVGVSVLTAAGMATTTAGVSSPNADLNDPLLRALDHFGLTAADPTNIVDADLAPVPTALLVRFLDYLRIETTQAALIHLSASPRYQQWEDYRVDTTYMVQEMSALLELLWADYRKRYLYSGAPAVGKMLRETRHELRTAQYFPPFPPGPINPPWPFGPRF